MKIIFAGGGTAGHINPALAVADYVRKHDKNVEILYVGAKGGMEEKLATNAGFDFKGIEISGFSRKMNLDGIKKNVKTLIRIFKASSQSRKILKEFNPDICMGTGGYVSGPILRAAYKKKIPIIIHEQNAFPGVTTKLLSKKANKVMLAVKEAEKHLDDKCNTIVTGNPIRSEILNIDKNKAISKMKFKNDKPIILSFGGSLGAGKINDAVFELIKWSVKNNKFNHIHAYGRYGKNLLENLKNNKINPETNQSLDIREYINNMQDCMAAADLVICRAGAITLSEIQAMGKPAILIPSPNVAENHQYHNAMALVKSNAASIIEESELSGEVLI